MRSRNSFATIAACLAVLAQPGGIPAASAQDAGGGGVKARLDTVLSVLRGHQNEAGKACLDAMTEVHQTEEQVGSLGQADSNNNHPDNGADIARDVLDSDYETAEAACRPDAERVCRAAPGDSSCAKLGLSGSGPGD